MTPCYKLPFVSRAAADKQLSRQRRQGKWKGPSIGYAYECPACGAWHLTSQPKRRRVA